MLSTILLKRRTAGLRHKCLRLVHKTWIIVVYNLTGLGRGIGEEARGEASLRDIWFDMLGTSFSVFDYLPLAVEKRIN